LKGLGEWLATPIWGILKRFAEVLRDCGKREIGTEQSGPFKNEKLAPDQAVPILDGSRTSPVMLACGPCAISEKTHTAPEGQTQDEILIFLSQPERPVKAKRRPYAAWLTN
jgi:hypothetical protein